MVFRIELENGLFIESNMDISDLMVNELKKMDSNNLMVLIPLNKTNENKNNYYNFLKVNCFRHNTYAIDLRLEHKQSVKQYRLMLKDLNKVINISQDYLKNSIPADINLWRDVTDDFDFISDNEIDEEIDNKKGQNIPSHENLLDQIQNTIIKEKFKKSDFEIENEINEYLNKEFNTIIIKKIPLWENLLLYLRSIGIENIYSISDAHRYKIQSIFKKAIQTFNDKKEKEYLENIMSFINTCISWKPNNKKFTKLEIDIFFRERNIKTSGIIKEIFRNKLNEKLQDI